MKLFISSLTSEVSQSDTPPQISGLTLELTGGADSASDTFLWFIRYYLASDFPEISGVTKNYFWIYCSHHANYGSSWGQSDNLDLSDFEEMGAMNLAGNSGESPTLYRVPASESYNGIEMLGIMYHPSDLPQQSRLYVNNNTADNSLSLTNVDGNGDWTYVNDLVGAGYATDKILGLHTLANGNQIGGLDETHTGYAAIRKRGVNDYEARHSAVSVDVPLVIYRYSYSSDGKNWVRGEDSDFISINSVDWLPSYQNYFISSNGSIFALSTIRINALEETDRPVAILKFDENYRNPYVYYYLDITNGISYFTIDNGIMYLYFIDSREIPNHVVTTTLDISNIDNWDVPDNTDVEPPTDGVNIQEWVKALDTEPPTVGTLSNSNVTNTTVTLTCPSSDNVGVIGYQMFLGQNAESDIYWKSIYVSELLNTVVDGLYTGRDYYLKVKSVDRVGNLSEFSNVINFQTT